MPELIGNWGILGGVFDPIHRGHLTLASEIHAARRLSGVLFVPSFSPPHKPDQVETSFDDRCAMVKLAIQPFAEFRMSRIEAESNEPNYSLNTIRALKKRFPQARFCFIVGADIPLELDGWHKPDELLAEIDFVVGSRPGQVFGSRVSRYGDSVQYIETSEIELSSTEVRGLIRGGISIEKLAELVGVSVADYIAARNLYQ